MKKVFALKLVGGLSNTSKMPGRSFGLPVSMCVTGSKLAQVEGSICSDCYAAKGFYRKFAHRVLPAQQARLAAFDEPEWVVNMTAALRNETHFRWFDSGDLQSPEMLRKIFEVARATPDTKHWLATRERSFVRQALQLEAVPENLVIRVSATFPDVPVKSMDMDGVQYANVHKDNAPMGLECNAPKQGGKCGECRACWSKDVTSVSYHTH